MASTTGIPGTALQSFRERLRRGHTLRDRLDALNSRFGDLFWYHPEFAQPPVLVIYEPVAAQGILQEESWIFNKALEPWHDRHQSSDPFERLIGDGLLLADGNHHRKHAALVSKKLSDPSLWFLFDSRLINLLNSYSCYVISRDITSEVSIQLARLFLEVYYGLTLTDHAFDNLLNCLNLAWASNLDKLSCPFRIRRRRSSRETVLKIDALKSLLRSIFDQQRQVNHSISENSGVQVTNQATVDESLVMAISFVHKLPALLRSTLVHIKDLSDGCRHALIHELTTTIDIPSTDCLFLQCPQTSEQIRVAVAHVQPPCQLLKRVTVCDAIIHGQVVPETTEIWIPTWPPQLKLLFGVGCYGCKGEQLSMLIAARFMQWAAHHV